MHKTCIMEAKGKYKQNEKFFLFFIFLIKLHFFIPRFILNETNVIFLLKLLCLNYSDAYYRYDPSAPPRGMGPPGYGAVPPVRHRAPHPLQQQQSQYPTYQPTPTDNMYSMADQHAGMGLGDITGWGGQPPPQSYGQPMGYGHPQTPQAPQRQTQAR